MEGNIWERYAEFRTRIDELDACAVHMSPDAVAQRLLLGVEGFFEESGKPPRTGDIAESIESIEDYYTSLADAESQAPPSFRDRIPELIAEYKESQPPIGDDHFFVAPDVGTRALLSEVAEEIDAHREDGYDPEDVPQQEQELATTKPGPPAEDQGNSQSTAGASDSSRSQDGEPKKPCKTCKEPKPLSDYYKDARRPDGLFAECKDCCRDRGRRNQEKRKVTTLPRTERTPEPERPKKKTRPEQLCGNGDECVAVDDVGHPTKLNNRNTSGICGPCEEHERNVGMSGRHSGHIVRHGAADRGQS